MRGTVDCFCAYHNIYCPNYTAGHAGCAIYAEAFAITEGAMERHCCGSIYVREVMCIESTA